MTAGTMHLDRATGRLLLNGVPVCAGCLVPLAVSVPPDERCCSGACDDKVAGELRPSPRRRRSDRRFVVAAPEAVAA